LFGRPTAFKSWPVAFALWSAHFALQFRNLTPQLFDDPQQLLTAGITSRSFTFAAPFSLGTLATVTITINFTPFAVAALTVATFTSAGFTRAVAFAPIPFPSFAAYTTLAIPLASLPLCPFAAFTVRPFTAFAFTDCRPVAFRLLAIGHHRTLHR
jgi:hypothetical protein